MESNVTDISSPLQSMADEIKSMRKTMESQHIEICRLNRNLDSLGKENRRFANRLSKYQKPDKNSKNSGTPPSREKMKDEVVRRTKSLRQPTGLKPGGWLAVDNALPVRLST